MVVALASLAGTSHADTNGKSSAKRGVDAEIKRGTLQITGNRRPNSVTLRLRRRARGTLEVDVRSDGSTDFAFRRRAFTRIVFRGAGGNDSLRISSRNGSFTGPERTVVDGERGTDRLVLIGSGGADSLTVAARRGRLRIARGSRGRTSAAATFTASARRVERLAIDPREGVDTIDLRSLSGAGVLGVAVDLDSGGDAAPDTVFAGGTSGADSLTVVANGSARALVGLPWAVSAFNLEPGSDRFIANGLAGADTLSVPGTVGPDQIDLANLDGLLTTAVSGTIFHADSVEAVRVTPRGGADLVTVNHLGADPLGGTDVDEVVLELWSVPGVPDGAVDSLTLNGGGGADQAFVRSVPTGLTVSGLAAAMSISAADTGDLLTVNGLEGNDYIDASGVAIGAPLLTLNGDAGDDGLLGGDGDDTLNGGLGDDFLRGGPGNDAVNGGGQPGDVVVQN